MTVQPGLCRTWSVIPKTGFLTKSLIRSTHSTCTSGSFLFCLCARIAAAAFCFISSACFSARFFFAFFFFFFLFLFLVWYTRHYIHVNLFRFMRSGTQDIIYMLIYSGVVKIEPHHEKTCYFAYAKTKAQISAFIFCHIDRTIPLLPKSENSSL